MLRTLQKSILKNYLFKLLCALCFFLFLLSMVTKFYVNIEIPDIKKIIDVANIEPKVLPSLDIQQIMSTTEIRYQKPSQTTTKMPKVLESKVLKTQNIQEIHPSTEIKHQEVSEATNKAQTLKKILFFTGIFTLEDWGFGFGQKPFERCPVSNCFTTNKQSDGPLISGFHMFLDFSISHSIY